MSVLASFLAAAALTIAPQANQPTTAQSRQAPAEEGVSQVEDVEVTARRLNEQVRSFVNEVATPPYGRNLARWDREICVGTANIGPRYAQIMIDRVSTTAQELGLKIGEPGCRPDVMIVASADADAVARRMVEENPNGFRPAQASTDRGSAALRRFQNTDAPVRWWHVSLPVAADTGEVAVRLIGEDPPTLAVRTASRLRANVRDDLARVLIIIDANQMSAISFGALTDYVTMIALAQIDPEADSSAFSSVLNVFDPTRQLTGFTNWDRDYLRGLYTADRDRAKPSQQVRDIVRQVVDANGSRQRAEEAEIAPN